jgi:uncharacterized protein (UPF0261 family)
VYNMNDPSNGRKTVVVMGTLDTKGPETLYLAERVRAAGCSVLLMDVGTHFEGAGAADISSEQLAAATGLTAAELRKLPRGEAVAKVSEAAARCLEDLVRAGRVDGAIGLGGSGGTTICSAAMRGLPYGVPKMLVSTLASGNTRWHVGISDIVMMPSIVDLAGLNPLLAMVLNNAARAIAGMVQGFQPYVPSGKRVVALTMYGTTTPGVSRARQAVEDEGFETWVFHASGVGGQTMERLMDQGLIQGVLDMTLAEIGAHLVGGLHDAGPDRLEAAGRLGLPQVIVPGAADTIVLPPRDQVPDKFRTRTLNFHNPTMTTMRTTVEENVAIGAFIARKLNRATGPVVVLLPKGGLSSIDRPGKIFYCPDANAALFETLREKLTPPVKLIEDEHHIDDPEFAIRAGREMVELLNHCTSWRKSHETV